MKKSLSIIIPYYNAMPYTKELLDVLAPQIHEYEWVGGDLFLNKLKPKSKVQN